MRFRNIDRLLAFREDVEGHVSTLQEIEADYHLRVFGTNCYYGINASNVTASAGKPTALQPQHRAILDDLIASLKGGPDDEKVLMLGVEPPSQMHGNDSYAYVSAHLDLVGRLATDLRGYQDQASELGKRLQIVVRYASEMNDPGQSQGNDPEGFRSTFISVREKLAVNAPELLMAFSPALRADLPEHLIENFWPGDPYVDMVSGTWYVGSSEQYSSSHANMMAYFLNRANLGKPFGLDEVGGCDAAGRNNDAVLRQMLNNIESLQIRNIPLKYATLFLASKWGTDATLGFITQPTQE